MKKIFAFSLLPMIILLVSCQKDINKFDPAVTADGKPAGAGGGGPSKLAEVPLILTVDDLNGIASDEKGNYIDGQDNVRATIRSSDGNFYLMTNTTFKPRKRWLNFPFNPNLEGKDDYRIVTGANIPLQNMSTEVGNNKQLAGMRVWAYVGKGVQAWNIRFHYAAGGQPNDETDPVLITRQNENVWTIEPTGNATAELFDENGILVGLFQVPFKLTLTTR